jgi:cobalt-zinc-cadmium efflux system protein
VIGHQHHHHDSADHGHHNHSHASNERRIAIAAVLTGGFMLAEAAGGLYTGSLALLADAGHMLTDAASLGLAWAAMHVSRRPHDWQRTYGFHRFQVLAAFTNGLTLFFIALAIAFEAARRLLEPAPVLAGPMLAIAGVGLLVNVASFAALHGAERENLNVRGAMLHVLGDLLGSVAAMAAAGIILWIGWTPIDPILSVAVALLILRSAWFLVRESGHILLEAAPKSLDVEAMRNDLVAEVNGVEDVHHVHAWSLTQDRVMVTLHACTEQPDRAAEIIAAIKDRLRTRYGIDHATVELEVGHCSDMLPCDPDIPDGSRTKTRP